MKTQTEWAIRNLELSGLLDKDPDYDGMVGEAVKELVETLGKQGHSGHSHAITLAIFNHVAQGKSLTLKHWQEKFDEFKKYYDEQGNDTELDEQAYIELGNPKPKD